MKTQIWMMTIFPLSQRVHVLQLCPTLPQFSTLTSVYVTTSPFPDHTGLLTFLNNSKLSFSHAREEAWKAWLQINSCIEVTTYQ